MFCLSASESWIARIESSTCAILLGSLSTMFASSTKIVVSSFRVFEAPTLTVGSSGIEEVELPELEVPSGAF
jgi:hypothetical protein